MGEFLVIGAGVSGCAAAGELARAGNHVELIEASSAAGGKILSYCCKATDECSRCGVCVAHTLVGQTLRMPGVVLTTGVRLQSVTRRDDGFEVVVARHGAGIDYRTCTACDACVDACPAEAISRYARAELVQYRVDPERCLLRLGRECTACSDACPAGAVQLPGAESDRRVCAQKVIVACGHEPFDARRKVRYGYGRLAKVHTGADLEEMLAGRSLPGAPGEDIAFVQCVGSRDPALGREFCSAVCCAYALRLARMLKHRDPLAGITIYFIDLQNFDRAFPRMRRELEEEGVRFVRGIPFDVRDGSGGKLRLLFEDPRERSTEAEHDRVVLSVGVAPVADATQLAEHFGFGRDSFGFLQSDGERLFVAGTCSEPQSIVDSIASARTVALGMVDEGRRA